MKICLQFLSFRFLSLSFAQKEGNHKNLQEIIKKVVKFRLLPRLKNFNNRFFTAFHAVSRCCFFFFDLTKKIILSNSNTDWFIKKVKNGSHR